MDFQILFVTLLKIIVLMKQLATIFLILSAFAASGQPKICYVVKYDLVERVGLPAESTKTTDAFGRVSYNTTLFYRYKEVLNPMEKNFSKREDAFRFYEAAKREYDIRNVAIDSMYYKIVLD